MKVVLDTQVKNKTKLRGEYGYVAAMKKRNFSRSLRYLLIMLLLYFGGTSLFPKLEVMIQILSLLLILPFSNFLARYLSFIKYKALQPAEFERLRSIETQHALLGELPIVRHKSVFFLRATIITGESVYALVPQEKSHKRREELKKGTRDAILSILSTKGHALPVILYDDYDVFLKDLEVMDKDRKQKEEVLEELCEVFITRAH